MPTKKEIREYNQYLKRKVLGLFDDYTTKHKNKNLPTALSSNLQQKKNREFLKKDLKRLGFEGTAFSKYGSYKFSKSAEEFVTKYANKQGFNGRVFRKTGETYSTFDTFVRSPLKPTGRRDKLMITYTVATEDNEQKKTFYNEFTDNFANKSIKDAIEEIVKKKFKQNDYRLIYVQGINDITVVSSKHLKSQSKKKADIKMKNCYILKQDWLKYAGGIAQSAYAETDNKCVPHQIRDYLLNPPKCRPTKFVDGVKTADAILFQDGGCGVSSKQVYDLCMKIKRNMYAYDEDDKCFMKLDIFPTHHYSPIVFYKINGHMYLINDEHTIHSVASSNKSDKNNFINSTSITDETKNTEMKVSVLETFEIEKAMSYEGICIIDYNASVKSLLLKFISQHKVHPRLMMMEGSMIGFTYKNEDEEIVKVVKNVNENDEDHARLVKVAKSNEIEYVNEGIGSVLCRIVDKSAKEERKPLPPFEHDGTCACCKCESDEMQIDHIVPLGNGGSNERDNLQMLCVECHKEKTIKEQEQGYSVSSDIFKSSFTQPVLNKIERFIKVHQMVDAIREEPDLSKTEQIDMCKCRRNWMKYSPYEWAVYSVMDKVQSYQQTDELVCGMYFVKTQNTFPFQQNGMYSHFLVQYGLDCGIIKKSDITHKLIPSKVLKKDYFMKTIEFIMKSFECEPDLQKKAVNSFVGLLGRTKGLVQKCKLTLDKHDAANWYVNNDETETDQSDWRVFIQTEYLEVEKGDGEFDNEDDEENETTPLYMAIFEKYVLNEKTGCIVYKWILEMEKMGLHQTQEILVENGYDIVELKTDAIRYK